MGNTRCRRAEPNPLDRPVDVCRAPRARDRASSRLRSRRSLKSEKRGQTPPPGELQGARRIIELRGCVTAQNLSKQFSVCACCLRLRSLLWPKMQTSERVNVSANSLCSGQTHVFSLCLRLLTGKSSQTNPLRCFG